MTSKVYTSMVNQTFSQILIYLTDFSGFIKKITNDVGDSGVHYDWLIIFFFVFAILLIALSLGRSRMLLALLSLYAAAFLEPRFVYFDKLRASIKNVPDYWLHLGLFLLIYALAFAILNRSILKHRLTLAESSIFVVVLIAIVEMGFLATIMLSYSPPELIERVPSTLIPFFATKTAQFWWALLPLLAVLSNSHKRQLEKP